VRGSPNESWVAAGCLGSDGERSLRLVNTLDWARTQFGVTTLFHFIFVPMSIGLAGWVALCQTLYYRTGNEVYLRMTRFWAKFFLISMAIGWSPGSCRSSSSA